MDTHTYLWFVAAPARCSAKALATLTNPANDLNLSVASVWEIAIKWNLGKLALTSNPTAFTAAQGRRYGIRTLGVIASDALGVATLPGHHRDPFDRLLIAQALRRRWPIITADPMIAAYGATVIW